MRGEHRSRQSSEPTVDGVADEQVRRADRGGRIDSRRDCRHHGERRTQRLRIARELHGGRIGEPLALPRHAGLQDAAGEHSDAAEQQRRDARHEKNHEPVAARVTLIEQVAPRFSDRCEAVEAGCHAQVRRHVAIQDVAVLVSGDRLQLIAVQVLERTGRECDGSSVARVASRERVDRMLLRQHEHQRLPHDRRDRHLLDDVVELTAKRIRVGRSDLYAAERDRDARAAARTAQVPGREQRDADDHAENHERRREGIDESHEEVARRRIGEEAGQRHELEAEGDQQDDGQVTKQQPARQAMSRPLSREEIAVELLRTSALDASRTTSCRARRAARPRTQRSYGESRTT
jgi:hypothetical protein